eukprot:1303572-Amphidinium_carterae.1
MSKKVRELSLDGPLSEQESTKCTPTPLKLPLGSLRKPQTAYLRSGRRQDNHVIVCGRFADVAPCGNTCFSCEVDYVKAVGSPFAVAENWNGGMQLAHLV